MVKPLTDPKALSRRMVVDSLLKLEKGLKDQGVPDDEVQTRVKEIAEKCGCDYPVQSYWPGYYEPFAPLGGATSFAAAEAYIEGREWQQKLDDLSWNLKGIMDNILTSKELTPAEIGLAIANVASEFDQRVAAFIDRESTDTPAEEDEESDAAAAVAALLGEREAGGIVPPQTLAGDRVDAKETIVPTVGQKAGKRLASSKLGLLQDVKDKISTILSWGSYMDNDPELNEERKDELEAASGVPPVKTDDADTGTKDLGTFTAFKDTDGQWRWFAIYSNRYFDREGEAFQEAAHKEYVAHVDQTGAYPDLWLWHQPIAAGKADWIDYSDGLAMASGTFSKGFEDVASALAAEKDLGVSHGYNYAKPDLQANGEYTHYRTFEISPLPGNKAANELTLFLPQINEEDIMALTPEKKEWLEKVAGKERVDKLNSALAGVVAAAKESGTEISYKELGAAFADDSSAPAASAADTSVPGSAPAAGTTGEEGALKAISDMLEAKLAPVLAQVKELQTAQDELFMPRAARFMTGTRPSDDPSNVVSGPRGGAETAASKELGLAAVILEANKQMTASEEGLEKVPAHMRYYAGIGMFGNIREPAEQPV